MTLSPKAAAWFEARAISPDVIAHMAIYSGKRVGTGEASEVVADATGDILCFPYIERGDEVAAKYRGRPRPDGSKVMWQKRGGKRTFYNADILDDPALQSGAHPLVIVEGEPDCLAVLTAGIPFVVSVPDGAPPDRDAQGNALPPVPMDATDIEPEKDDKFKFIVNNWDRLKKIKRFVLMTDPDGPGQRLRDELARRLGRVRCSFVLYPSCGEKKPDANEVLIQHGPTAIIQMLATAKPMPVKGLYKLKDFPPEADFQPLSTGWGRLDMPASSGMAGLMLDRGIFMTVLGKPEGGKSTWTTQLAARMAKHHGWNIGIATFEMRHRHMAKLLRNSYLGRLTLSTEGEDYRRADMFINKHFTFIRCDTLDEADDPTIEWILDRAGDAVIRDGIDMLIIDPWNEADHQRRRDESLTEYTGRAIKRLKRFAQVYNVLVCVVIHPTKEGGLSEKLSMYDAADSAHWVNKPDIGVLIERDYATDEIDVKVGKMRYRALGQRGTTRFSYLADLEIFSE